MEWVIVMYNDFDELQMMEIASDENEAIETAKEWADQDPNYYIYIEYFSESEILYLNPDGYHINGKSWA